MSSPVFTAAVLGLGNIGLLYDYGIEEGCRTHTSAYRKHPGFRLVGGVDPDADRRRQFESCTGAKSYESLDQLLEDGAPEVISVCVPSTSHFETLERLAPLRPRFVIMEKPVVYTREELAALKTLLEVTPVPIEVNYLRQFLPTVRRFQAAAVSGAYGPPMGGHVHYVKGVKNNASHYLNIVLGFLGRPERSTILGCPNTFDGDPSLEFVLHYDGFQVVFQAGDWDRYHVGEVDLFFETGRIRFSRFFERAEFYRVQPWEQVRGMNVLVEETLDLRDELSNHMLHLMDHAHQFLTQSHPGQLSFESACETLEWCFALEDQYEQMT